MPDTEWISCSAHFWTCPCKRERNKEESQETEKRGRNSVFPMQDERKTKAILFRFMLHKLKLVIKFLIFTMAKCLLTDIKEKRCNED